MWKLRSTDAATEESKPGIFARVRIAWNAARGLIATRKQMFREEVSAKGAAVSRGAVAFVLALVFGWLAFLVLTALIAVLLGKLLGSAWAGLLATFVLYLAAAGAGAMVGIKAFKGFKLLDFPETKRGLREDWETVRDSLREPPAAGEESDLEQRFRAGSE